MSVVRSVVVRLSANTSAYKASMSAAASETEASARRMSGAMARSSTESQASLHKLESTARRVGTFAGLSIAGGLIVATKAAADFAEKQALVDTLAHSNARTSKQLADAALSTGKAYGYTATQVSDAEAELVKAGVSTKNILNGGLKGALTLAAAGQTDVAQATEYAAAAMTQFRLSGAAVPHIADLLASGADKALGSVDDLGYALKQSGTTAHQMGLSVEQTVGTLTAFAQAGLIGQRGGTTFKQMLLQLAAPTNKAADIMDMLHLSLYNASGQIKTMPQLADNLRSSLGRLTPAQRNYAMGVIFGSRAIQGANILMAEGGKGISGWIRKVNDQGFAAQQASGKLNSLKGDLTKLKSEGQNDLIALGSGSQAPLRQFVQNITGALEKARKDGDLKKWGHEVESTLVSLGRTADSVGRGLEPVAAGVAKIVTGFTKLPKGLQEYLGAGAVIGYAAKRTGVLGYALNGGSKTALGGLATKAGVVPVYVTNWGGKSVPGLPGNSEKRVATTVERDAAEGAGARAAERAAGTKVGASVLERVFGRSLSDVAPKVLRIAGRTAMGVDPIGDLIYAGGDSPQRPMSNAKGQIGLAANQLIAAIYSAGKLQGSYSMGGAVKEAVKVNPAGVGQAVNAAAQTAGVPYQAYLKGLEQQYPELAKAAKAYNDQLDRQAQAQNELTGLLLPRYAKTLKSLPSAVQTAIATPGAIESMNDVRRLARQYNLTPKQIRTLVALSGVAGALNAAQRLQRQLAGLHDRTVTVTVAVNGAAHAAAVLANYKAAGIGSSAAGSTVPDDGGPYADRFPYLLAPKEEVVSNGRGQAERYRPVLKAINADLPRDVIRGMLAAGGTPGQPTYTSLLGNLVHAGSSGSSSGSSGSSGSRSTGTKKTVKKKAKKKGNPFTKNERASIDLTFDLTESLSVKTANKDIDRFALSVRSAGGHISHSLEGLKKRVDANITAYDKEAAKRDLLVESRDNTKSAVSSALGQNIFAAGGLDSAWMTPSGQFGAAIATLHANNTRSKAYLTAEKQLKDKGLKNDALGQLEANGDLATLQAFAAQSKTKLASYQHLFNVTQGNITKASNYAGSSYAASIALSNKHLATMSHQLESLEQAVQHSAVATGKALGKELNHTTSRAAHRAKTKAGRPL